MIGMREACLIISNSKGLHARPAAQFVQTAAGFKSAITISGNGKTADAKSILAVMTMGLVKGTELKIVADGADEKECIEALVGLVESRFGEGEEE